MSGLTSPEASVAAHRLAPSSHGTKSAAGPTSDFDIVSGAIADLHFACATCWRLKEFLTMDDATRRGGDRISYMHEVLVDYEVADVTAAATYYIAEIYQEFSTSLLESERPAGLTDAEKLDYEMVIEEEAYPFEERAIEVHEQNFELLASGIYNPWVQKSLDTLAVLMPGRYAKNESSEGFIGSIGSYAYRMPIAPEPTFHDTGEGGDGQQEERRSETAASLTESQD